MQKYLTLLLIFSLVLGTPVFAGLAQDIASQEKKVASLQKDYDALKADAASLQNEADSLKTTRDNAYTAMKNAEAALAAAAEKDKAAAEKTYDSAVSAYNSANSAYTSKQSSATAKQSDANAKKAELTAAQNELAALKAVLDSDPFKFVDEFNSFASANPAFDTNLNQVKGDIANEAEKYADFEASQQYVQTPYVGKSDDYMAEAASKFQEMNGVFNANAGKAGVDNLRKEYEEHLGEFCKYYAQDMVSKPTDPKTGAIKYTYQNYMDDFANLNQSFKEDVQNLSFDTTTSSNNDRIIDPREAGLDKTMESITGGGALKIELGWVGVAGAAKNDLGNNIYQVVNNIQQGKLYNDKTLKDNADWFTSSWQSLENAEMELPVKNTAATYASGQAGTYVVNPYGEIVNKNTDGTANADYKEADYGDLEVGVNSTYYNNVRFNNRSYGYQYTDGSYNVASVTVGKKKYVLQHTVFTSPIVLDMDGNGKLEASAGEWRPIPNRNMNNSRVAEFDLNGDGFLEIVEWVGSNDGILVQYTEGEINGNNLFGEAGGWSTGYEKLMLFDANKDMVLNGEELSKLSVWQDKNSDAKVDQGEISTLKDAGIESLNLNHTDLASSFTQNGVQKTMWDWYPLSLQVKRSE